MNDWELSRREVLAGLTAAGSTGAFVGTGTAAMFADEESFVDNLAVAGVVDLRVDWNVAGGPDGSSEGDASIPITLERGNTSGEAELTVTLPDGDGNNPVYGWLRAACPTGSLKLAEALEVTLSYRNGDQLASGSLVEIANALSGGVPISPDGDASVSPGGQACVDTGGKVDLHLDWKLQDTAPKGVNNRSTSLEFGFVGRQCRNNDGTVNPFAVSAGSCSTWNSTKNAISFIAFCTDSTGSIEPSIDEVNSTDDSGDPISVDWSTAVEVDYVVVKFGSSDGPQFTIYDFRNDDGKTTGIATSNDGGAAIPSYDQNPGDAAKPCAVADRELDESDSFSVEQSIKLNYNGTEFKEEEIGRGPPGRNPGGGGT